MIDDPIQCSKKKLIITDRADGLYFTHFLKTEGTQLEHLALRIAQFNPHYSLNTDIDNNILFSIVKSDYGLNYNCVKPHISYASKEQFVDMVSSVYQEYFEWLLFHPEWLWP